ncbi:MAG: YwiC-like family protein [Gemmatimonadales bacterium]
MAQPNRSLLPREHGAYAELGFPLLSGLGLGRPGVAAFSFALAAVLFFLLHEPLAILAGVRGERVLREHGPRARSRAALIAAGGLTAGTLGLLAAPAAARVGALIPGGFALALAPLALTGRVKNLAGEILVAAALAGTLVPVALASRVEWSYALLASCVWFASFALATFTVHALKARVKQHLSPPWTVAAAPVLGMIILALGIAIGYSGMVPPLTAAALLPPAVATLAVNAVAVHPRRLRRVGWSLVAANVLTAALLLGGH